MTGLTAIWALLVVALGIAAAIAWWRDRQHRPAQWGAGRGPREVQPRERRAGERRRARRPGDPGGESDESPR